MAARNLVPDLPCSQELVNCDADVYAWHHRLLLVRGSGQQWIWASPDKASRQWREETTTRDKNKKDNKNKKEGAGG